MRSIFFSVLLFSVAAFDARADDAQMQPAVQVTASRVAETVDETLADVSVITREDIDASGARDVYDLLRLQAGVDLYRTGGAGQQTSLFLRGTNANHVLVLIDGVRAASINTGAFAFEQLPIDTVERIEIVRGPRASYWGSDAIGGVIQIFTRKLEGPRVSAGYSSDQDADGVAGIGHWNGADGYSVQVGARHVGGFSATNPGICNGPDDPYCTYNPDDDGLRNTNLVARGAHSVGTQLLSGSIYRSQGEVEFDQGNSNVIEQVAGVNLDGPLASGWTHHLAVNNQREDINTPTYYTLYKTRRNELIWQNDFAVTDNQRLVAGLDFLWEEGETRDTFSGIPLYDDSRDNHAVFGGWRGTFGAFDSEISLRHDDNSTFGGATTGTAAAGWRANELVRVYASYGQGFRSPTLNELFSPGYGGFFAGNPALDPERSHSSEIGLDVTPSATQRITFNVYSTLVRDLISFTGTDFQAENIASAKIDGAELTWNMSAGRWQLFATYTWQDARNDDTGEQLVRRPKQKISGVAEYAFTDRFDAGAELIYASSRKDIADTSLSSYTVVNLRATLELSDAWSLTGRIENIGDEDYELVHGYNTPGRTAFLEVIWKPGAR